MNPRHHLDQPAEPRPARMIAALSICPQERGPGGVMGVKWKRYTEYRPPGHGQPPGSAQQPDRSRSFGKQPARETSSGE